ncbi:MAG TPA: glycosyltransferase family 39 protein [Candidatus Acidoferrum sp.]|nr:glycosyltransferase family 39 protein [Candidatus Acidoferrum sp.]
MKRTFQKAATSLALIVIVATGVRVGFALDQARKIAPGVLGIVPFQQETGNIAYALAQGKGFSNVFRTETGPTAWLAPVYPLIVAATFKLFGVFTTRAFFACVALNILFSAAACVPIFFAGKRVGGLGVAAGAAWLWAVFPSAMMMPFEWIWDTSLSALLAALILWATLELAESERWLDWAVYGVLWGLALMTNPALGAMLPFLLGWVTLRGRGESRARWKRSALAVGVAILCCVPWTIRNYAAFHRFIPVRSNLPFELWLGNNDIFDEHARNGRRSITRTEEARRYAQLGETAYMAEKWELATSFMRTHPGLELQLMGKKFVDFWLGTESPVKNFRETDSWLIRGVLLSSFLTAAGALCGVVVLWVGKKKITRRRREHRASAESSENDDKAEEMAGIAVFPLAVFPVVFPCLYYVTHADLRYRHPIDPIVLMLMAVTVAAVGRIAIRASRGVGSD